MDMFVQILIAASIPSTVIGVCVWMLKRKIDHYERQREEKERDRDEYNYLSMASDNATIKALKAIAIAVRDKKCNGEMGKAMQAVEDVEKKQSEFVRKQAVKILRERSA